MFLIDPPFRIEVRLRNDIYIYGGFISRERIWGGALKYSIPGKDQFRYIKIHLRLRGLGLNEAKEIISRLILLFPRASEPSMNFNVSS